jgi:hypothetical protein
LYAVDFVKNLVEEFDEGFFVLARDHYDAIRSLIRMRDDWVGKT